MLVVDSYTGSASTSDDLPERGVIMGLEYGKKVTDTNAPGDVRTGKEEFMATEVAYAEHYRLTGIRLAQPLGPAAFVSSQPAARHGIDLVAVYMNDGSACPFRAECFRLARTHTSHLSVLRSLLTSMEGWQKALNRFYSVSYKHFDKSPIRLAFIRIDSWTIQSSYKMGQTFLQTMIEAPNQLSTTFVPCPRAFRRKVTVKRSRTKTKSQHIGPSMPHARRSMAGRSYSRSPDGVVIPVSKKRRTNES
ncbi:unnamed protein product [Rhizoctonia solani]|uniref:Fungal-type protein kinase domain-containing protein n=1 Tax=Rhizoctonia solani TaxID=456999 RepID=A0A8H3GQ10_9AGAM|nr:unnamed protein product [Rhizoctonia solani]